MECAEVKQKIKQIIFETTNIPIADIEDNASFVEDLELDSLTLLEIAVNVDQEFGLDLPEEVMEQFSNVEVSVGLVMEHMAEKKV